MRLEIIVQLNYGTGTLTLISTFTVAKDFHSNLHSQLNNGSYHIQI